MNKTAKDVAQFLLSLIDTNVGDTVSNLKLQKLLYYCQGYYLALYNKPLFEDKIYAWDYGPVVRTVYDEYKFYGSSAIVPVMNYCGKLTKAQRALVLKVYEQYGQFSAGKLVDMTHNEAPWKTTKKNTEITLDKLKNFFYDKI